MTRVHLKYVTADHDRHGNVRYYFRKRGLKVKTRIQGLPGSIEFMTAYEALLCGKTVTAQQPSKPLIARANALSLRWLCQQYIASGEFKRNDGKTQRIRAHLYAAICDAPLSDTNPTMFGEGPFAELTSKAIRRLIERKADTPSMMNHWLQALKALFKWAIAQEYCTHNPAKDIPKIKTGSEGYHPWTADEVARLEATHPVGTTARLALALLLYTGQKSRNPVTLDIPVLPALAEIIEATGTGHLVFLLNSRGKAFSHSTFGDHFRQWCNAATPPHRSAHGLRGAGASRAAENGATAPRLMAIFGWRDIKQAEFHIRAAEQKKLAGASMHLIKNMDKY